MNEYKVISISKVDYIHWITKRHYAKRMPSISFAFGLFLNGVLVAVCSFGCPSSSPLRKACGDEFRLLELNRLISEDFLAKNSLSFFVAKCLKLLKEKGAFLIVSYADTAQGHNGYIYQATNFIYTGLSAKRTDWKIKGMEQLHGATIADISRGKKDRAKYMRKKFGDSFYLEERSRKHRYFFFIGSKSQKKKMKKSLPYKVEPYPKGANNNYEVPVNGAQQVRLFT